MKLDEIDHFLEEISLDDFKQFRILYNELLGYISRNELDNIRAFEQRILKHAIHAVEVQRALQKRIQNFKINRKDAKKQELHHQFMNPKQNIPVTDPFPCKTIEEEPAKPVASTLDHFQESKTQTVLDQMAQYDQKRRVDQTVAEDIKETHEVNHTISAPSTKATTSLDNNHDISIDDIDMGHRLNNIQLEENLAITSESVAEEKKVKKEKKKQVNKLPNDQAYENRKNRIQEYIKKDQEKGGIEHEL